MTLAGRVALVTGAGRGVGRAIALALAREGASVGLAARTRTELDAVAATIAESGGRALVLPVDVSIATDVERLVADTVAKLARLDVLVTSAGVASFGPVVEAKTEDWDSMLSVNLRGAMLACRAAAPRMIAQGVGTIINVASIAATRVLPGAAAYGATKAGLVAFSRVLAEELRGTGVRVGLLVPGAVDTPLWDAIPGAPDRRRMLQPEDVARAAVLMASLPARASLEELTLLPAEGIL
jgi:NAD(P)-dependent dehydrogenase (short-subunit alcohol dehydrogenase family)